MDAGSRPERLSLTLPAAGAIAGGVAVLLAFLVVPAWRLEHAVSASGIPAILAAAEPPLGFTARIALGLVFGGMVAGFAWFGLSLLAGDRPLAMPSAKNWGRYRFDMAKWTALLRRTTRPGDGTPRPPLFANRELGTPFLDVKAPPAPPLEQDIPLDLDQPLAAFDPGAVLAEPLPPPEPLTPLARPQIIDPGDRFETFELTPMQRIETPPRAEPVTAPIAAPVTAPTAVVAPETESTVHALLERLERGLGKAAIPQPTPVAEPLAESLPPALEPAAEPAAPAIRQGSLADTLGDLRRLARGGQ